MSLTMSPQTAAGILLPILLVMDFVAIYIYWNKWDLKNIKIIIPSSIIGIIVGTFTFSFISDDGIRIIIGIIAILFIFLSIIFAIVYRLCLFPAICISPVNFVKIILLILDTNSSILILCKHYFHPIILFDFLITF